MHMTNRYTTEISVSNLDYLEDGTYTKGISWPSYGTISIEEAKQFMSALQEAIAKAESK